MDAIQRSHVEKRLLELLMEDDITPEQALQYLSSPCMVPWSYGKGDSEHLVIFMAYLKFIMARRPRGKVDGIWEEIFRKTVVYSRNVTDFKNEISQLRRNNVSNMYNMVIPIEDGIRVNAWLYKALSTKSKCPNPYIRLELFRMIRLFQKHYENRIWDRLTETLLDTISEIQPHFLNPNGDVGDILFGVNDLDYILSYCCGYGDLCGIKDNIFYDVDRYKKEVVYSKETRFISNCIQLIGVFAVMAGSISDPGSHITMIKKCFSVFRTIRNLVGAPFFVTIKPGWNQIRYVLSLPEFHRYVIETVRDLTTAIINNNTGRDIWKCMPLITERDDLTWDLDVYTKICDLPRLLLYRQGHGSMFGNQKFLLLRNLQQFTVNNERFSVERISNENIANESSSDESNDNESNVSESDGNVINFIESSESDINLEQMEHEENEASIEEFVQVHFPVTRP
ncbi:unnamed protein product [Meganyctiphanes norvegica]|uniref:Uncharacterized protein n=1 Tax=Meganyctiphanes norvegica TaxID=48144 RepID=A0AAV2SDK1_MEGNR